MEMSFTFNSRHEFVAAASDTSSQVYYASDGSITHAGGFMYRKTGSSAIADIPGWEPYNQVWVEHFGTYVTQNMSAANDDTTDNSPMFQSAIEYMKDGGVIHLSDGYYRLESTVTVPYDGIRLVGNGERSTLLFADHTNGPILHVMEESCELGRFACLASSNRKSQGGALCVGIRFQVEDIPDSPGRLKNTLVHNVRVASQPSHGIVISNAFTGTFNRVWVISNKGHGIAVDRGFAYPMQNIEGVPGLCAFNESQIVNNSGHGLAFGHPDDEFTTQALRMTVTNCEISKNASDGNVRYEHAQVYCRATEVTFTANVFKPDPGSGSSGVYVAGRCITMDNNRFIDVGHVALIGSYDIFPTLGVYITGFNVISSPLLTSAVRVIQTAGQTSEPSGIYVNNYNFNGGVDTLMDTDTGGVSRVPKGNIGGTTLSIPKLTDQSVSDSIEVVMDDHLKFWVCADETIRFTVYLEYSGPSSSDFRCTLLAPSGSTCRFSPISAIKASTSDSTVVADVVSAGGYVWAGSDSAHRLLTLSGFISNGNTAGYVNVAWRQSKAGSTTTVHAGLSCIDLNRVVK
jgi:hypothetical protein